jgi:oligogalacturonide lyase
MKTTSYRLVICLLIAALTIFSKFAFAQPVLETGGQKMPDEWIDKTTNHKIIKLTRREGNNTSFYFHNDPFVGNKMIFYGTDFQNTAKNDSVKQETYNITAGNSRYTVST